MRLVAGAAVVLLFLVANRGAYRGYFSDDDLNNIAWARQEPASTFVEGLAAPRYYLHHFRPVGHSTFAALAQTAGLDFRWYVAVLHLLHIATCLALWRLLLRLGAGELGAACGAVFLLFQMALFEAIWKPMYLFDVWCGLFSVLTLLAWTGGRFWLSLVFFWFAFKSKEHAVMLVPAIAMYEWWLGERRWKRLAPMVAVAMVFGLQGVFMNRQASPDYTLHASVSSIGKTVSFYFSRVWVAALLLVPAARDRRAWWGLGTALALLFPLLMLPGRLFAAYLYAPMLGVAIVAAVAASRVHWGVIAAFFAIWIPWNYQQMREQRRTELTTAQQNRAYVRDILELPRRMPDVRNFIHDGAPPGMKPWGIEGILRTVYDTMQIDVYASDSKDLARVVAAGPVALLSWDALASTVHTHSHRPGEPDASYLETGRYMPVWQLLDGWYEAENTFRWTKPRATARLWKPAGAREFEVRVNVGSGFLREVGRPTLAVSMNGLLLGEAAFDAAGWQTARVPVPSGPAATVTVEFASPLYRPASGDPRKLGVPLGAFGFKEPK